MKVSLRLKLTISFLMMIILSTTILVLIGQFFVSKNQMYGKGSSSLDVEYSNDIFTTIGVLFIIFVICAALMTWMISRSVLIPLKELNTATEQIINGNLDFEIGYQKNNEMGRFIRAFEQMRIKLKESLAKQIEYENSRNELIENIAHDLRTPISSIKGYVEGLQDGIVHDEAKFNRYLSVIKEKSITLDILIDDLFQFSRLELGKIEMEIREQDSQDMIETIVRPFEIELSDSNVSFVSERPFPKAMIQADRHRITQVFDNFISNARRYVSDTGKITVQGKISDNFVQISIKDNGVGISKDDLPYVFNRFYRGEKSRSREFGGTGLGLAICKQIVEEHGGRIWVESEMDKGTTFFFTLPIIEYQDEF